MSEIPLRPTDQEDEHGDPIYLRVMNAEEIRERAAENATNTAPALRAKILAALADRNGAPA